MAKTILGILENNSKPSPTQRGSYIISTEGFEQALKEYLAERNKSLLAIIQGDSESVEYHLEFKKNLKKRSK